MLKAPSEEGEEQHSACRDTGTDSRASTCGRADTKLGCTLPEPAQEERIGILYPRMHPRYRVYFDQLHNRLRRQYTVCWLNRDRDARKRVNAPGIKIQTIHSAKRLQYQAVILMWAELMFPPNLPDDDEETYRRLLYVALTRAEDYLTITSCGHEFPPRETYPTASSAIDTGG